MLSRAIRGGVETIWDTLTMKETRIVVVEVAMDSTTTILRVLKVDAIEVGEALASIVRRTSTSMKATMREDMTTINEAESSRTRKEAAAVEATTTATTKGPKARLSSLQARQVIRRARTSKPTNYTS